MKDELLICWSHLDETQPAPVRPEVREWIEELHLPSKLLTRGTPGKGIKAARDTQLVYEDEQGHSWSLTTRTAIEKDEFTTYDVVREPDRMRVGQLKHFKASRARDGISARAEVIRTMVRPNLEEPHAGAARAWVETAQENFRQAQGAVPWSILRRIVREALLEVAVPIRGPAGRPAFYAYADAVRMLTNTQELCRRMGGNSELILLPLDRSADRRLFAESADELMALRVHELMVKIQGWQTAQPKARRIVAGAVATWRQDYTALLSQITEHEKRLKWELTDARSELLIADQWIRSVDQNGNLPYVNEG